eukprot:s2822_g7.t4
MKTVTPLHLQRSDLHVLVSQPCSAGRLDLYIEGEVGQQGTVIFAKIGIVVLGFASARRRRRKYGAKRKRPQGLESAQDVTRPSAIVMCHECLTDMMRSCCSGNRKLLVAEEDIDVILRALDEEERLQAARRAMRSKKSREMEQTQTQTVDWQTAQDMAAWRVYEEVVRVGASVK